ncbi:MAG: aromatic ring-hydroxylating dioxygenase subunit alpha [Alphaproteobacteria bacterium]|nr:aromatic ring-hydroxylating dioxygenase subunit alpha [Alphaproteobacteria bacterium]
MPDGAVDIDDLLETGLINNWYLVCRDTDLGDTPLALKRLARDIVLWRDGKGGVHCVEDFCPHRGARLSIGQVCDGFLTCAYHGLQFDGRGTVVATPPTPASPIVGQRLARSFPAEEAHGVIWVFFGDALHDDPPPLVFPDEFSTGEWSGFVDIRVFECNYQLVRDNQLDPIHGSYLHAGTHALSWGRKDADFGFEKTADGFVIWRTNQQGVNLDRTWVFHREGSGYWAISDLPFPKNEGGGMVRLFRYPTPIDRDHSLVWNYRLQKRTGWRRDLWRFMYKNRVHDRGAEVMEQDRLALSSIPRDARKRENLLPCDIGVARIRRLYRDEMARHVEALAAAGLAAE